MLSLPVLSDSDRLLAAGTFVLLLLGYVYSRSETYKLRHIPTVGFNNPVLSYISAIRFLLRGPTVLREAHIKYGGGIFKIARFTRWEVIITGKEYMSDLRTARDDCLSIVEAIEDEMQTTYTMGSEISHNPYHIQVVRSQLTKNIGNMLSGLHDEFVTAFNESVPPEKEWKAYPAMDLFLRIVCRTSNRGFVGLPLCRNKEYLDGCVKYTTEVLLVSQLLNLSPKFLIPFLGSYCLTMASRRIRTNSKFLEPLIEERLRQRTTKKAQDDDDGPSDLVSWLMDAAPEDGRTPQALSQRLMVMNFASIHTTSLALVHSLYNLASKPNYVAPLRQEIQEAIAEEGWTKAGLEKMPKLDSFLKETQRMNASVILIGFRVALKDFTFTDGVTIPKGTKISYNIEPVHYDEAIYANPDEFDGFRYFKDKENGDPKSGIIFMQDKFLSFGFGKHACPGRFYAAAELKMMFAHMILNYDMKTEKEGIRPSDFIQGAARVPNLRAKVLFRKHHAATF